jgi:phosphoribosyl-AMP cyclohydrolase
MEIYDAFFEQIRFDARGLVPAVVQDVASGGVLLCVLLNHEALERSLETGLVHYYSSKMRKVWQKGEASGHRQRIKAMRVSCQGDALLIQVEPLGGACEQGYNTCFFRQWGEGRWDVAEERSFDPELVYPEYAFSH